MAQKRPSRVELLRGTLDLLIMRTLLHRLEAKGWITASWELSEKGKRARYYRITPTGRQQMAREQSKWDAFARAMGLLLRPADQEGQ